MKKAITDIRGLDSSELRTKLQDLRKEQFGLRFRGSAEEGKKTTRQSEVRRTIARILMVLGDRDRLAAQGVAASSVTKGSVTKGSVTKGSVTAGSVARGKK